MNLLLRLAITAAINFYFDQAIIRETIQFQEKRWEQRRGDLLGLLFSLHERKGNKALNQSKVDELNFCIERLIEVLEKKY